MIRNRIANLVKQLQFLLNFMKINNKEKIVFLSCLVLLFLLCIAVLKLIGIIYILALLIIALATIMFNYKEISFTTDKICFRKFHPFKTGCQNTFLIIPKIDVKDFSINKIFYTYYITLTLDSGGLKLETVTFSLRGFYDRDIIGLKKMFESVRKENLLEDNKFYRYIILSEKQ